MRLYFQRANGEEVFISNNVTDSDVGLYINMFLKERDYKSSYTRGWYNDDGDMILDVGSHTEFFILKK